MSLIHRFSAAEEEYVQAHSTPPNERTTYTQQRPSHLQTLQTILHHILRSDPHLSQERVFRHYAPAFVFTCLLGAVWGAVTHCKLGIIIIIITSIRLFEQSHGVVLALTLAVVALVSVVLALLVLLRVIIWVIACAVDAFLEIDLGTRNEERHLQLNASDLLFGGIFS